MLLCDAARRTTLGIDPARVALPVAILEKKIGVQLLGQDVLADVVGGVRPDDPASDPGALMAVASSFLDRPLDAGTVVAGEAGLAGEVRAIAQAEARLRRAAKRGFRRSVIPESSRRQLGPPKGPEVTGVRWVHQAWAVLLR